MDLPKLSAPSILKTDTSAHRHEVSAHLQGWERRLGYSVESRDPEKGIQPSGNELIQQESAHPKFANNQRFDGYDPSVTPNPVDNPEAYEELKKEAEEKKLRLQKQLQKRNEAQNVFNPRPMP